MSRSPSASGVAYDGNVSNRTGNVNTGNRAVGSDIASSAVGSNVGGLYSIVDNGVASVGDSRA